MRRTISWEDVRLLDFGNIKQGNAKPHVCIDLEKAF